jgi:DNA-binding transcriptional ArsR family regulator
MRHGRGVVQAHRRLVGCVRQRSPRLTLRRPSHTFNVFVKRGSAVAGTDQLSMPAVSRHLKVLEHAALISRTRSGKWRASHLETAPLREAADWIDRFRRFWDSSLDRLDAHLAAVQAAERTDNKEH